MTYEDVIDTIKTLPDNSIIFHLIFLTDNTAREIGIASLLIKAVLTGELAGEIRQLLDKSFGMKSGL